MVECGALARDHDHDHEERGVDLAIMGSRPWLGRPGGVLV